LKGIWKYSHLLPAVGENHRISLGEADTPMIRSRQLGPALGLPNLYFKLEQVNPSGSYKDRFAASAVAHLLARGSRFCLATSSGNTGAALAAYCAAAGIKCFLAIVDGAPLGKVRQMQAYGAETMMVKGFGKDLRITEQVVSGLNAAADYYGTPVQISAYAYSPLGMTGVQTIAYEIADQLPFANVQVFSPAGGGGLTLALAKGFKTWQEQAPRFTMPRVHCVQPLGNDSISTALRRGSPTAQAVAESTTSISGLQVPNIIDGNEVVAACRTSGGSGYTATDELIYECQRDMAMKEGIFCEPAGAVGFAGLLMALKQGEINTTDHIVCLVTGHGFKDPVSVDSMAKKKDLRHFAHIDETLQYIRSQIQDNHKENFP
jgi:threonine synthase